jgi:hypothetical protein
MENITIEYLENLLSTPQKNEFTEKYSSWRKLDFLDLDKMELVGKLDFQNGSGKEYETEINYWSFDYPIALNFFPNSKCEIYKINEDYFMVYRDFGGHAPEKRCRYINKDLIVFSS